MEQVNGTALFWQGDLLGRLASKDDLQPDLICPVVQFAAKS